MISILTYILISQKPVTSLAYVEDLYEYNNTIYTAKPVYNGTYYGNIHIEGDIDYFSFISKNTTSVTIDLLNIPVNCDYDIELYDNNNTLISSSRRASNYDERIIKTIDAAKIYYIKIYSYRGISSSNYKLTISGLDTVTGFADQYELNNSFDTATNLGLKANYSIYANIDSNDDKDYYRFETDKNAIITVSLIDIPSGTDYELKLYNSNKALIGSSTKGLNYSEEITVPQEDGLFYVYVYPYNGYSNLNYNLRIQVIELVAGDKEVSSCTLFYDSIITSWEVGRICNNTYWEYDGIKVTYVEVDTDTSYMTFPYQIMEDDTEKTNYDNNRYVITETTHTIGAGVKLPLVGWVVVDERTYSHKIKVYGDGTHYFY